jgi:hypothetical protein
MMYSCGHDSNGERCPEYEALLPHQRMPMSSGQCPKCREMRYRFDTTGSYRGEAIKIKNIENASSVQVIPPDPEILKIARIFLEKYEILSEKDRSAYSGFISSLMNPPFIYNKEDK